MDLLYVGPDFKANRIFFSFLFSWSYSNILWIRAVGYCRDLKTFFRAFQTNDEIRQILGPALYNIVTSYGPFDLVRSCSKFVI